MGSTERTRGHDWERELCPYLTERLGVKVVTKRKEGLGLQEGSDLTVAGQRPPNVLGWSVECKASINSHQVTKWCRQAAEDAAPFGLNWVVLAWNPGASSPLLPNSPGDGTAYVGTPGGLVPAVGGSEVRSMSIEWFVDLLLVDWGE